MWCCCSAAGLMASTREPCVFHPEQLSECVQATLKAPALSWLLALHPPSRGKRQNWHHSFSGMQGRWRKPTLGVRQKSWHPGPHFLWTEGEPQHGNKSLKYCFQNTPFLNALSPGIVELVSHKVLWKCCMKGLRVTFSACVLFILLGLSSEVGEVLS